MLERKISNSTAFFMIAVAILFDVMQIIATVTVLLPSVVNVFANLTFYLWFRLNGVSFTSTKRIFTFFGFSLLEYITFVDVLPMITISTFMVIRSTRKEESAPLPLNNRE